MRPRTGSEPALTNWEQTSRLLVIDSASNRNRDYTPSQWRLIWRCRDALHAVDEERAWQGVPSIFD